MSFLLVCLLGLLLRTAVVVDFGREITGEISTMDINPICIITVLVLWLLLDPEARSSHHKVVLGHTEWVPFG